MKERVRRWARWKLVNFGLWLVKQGPMTPHERQIQRKLIEHWRELRRWYVEPTDPSGL